MTKDFNVLICKICSRRPNCNYIDNANMKLNENCGDGLHFLGKGKNFLINSYLDEVCIF